MPYLAHGSYRIRYELEGPDGRAGLCAGQRAYAICRTVGRLPRRRWSARGFRVATFDMLGQGASDKPGLFISQDDQVAALGLLIDRLGNAPVFLGGISFGGLIALRYAIAHPDRLAGLVRDERLCRAVAAARCCSAMRCAPGLILGGTSYLQDLLLPMNLSDAWLGAAARQSRRREAAGLAHQRRLCAAEPDGVLPRFQAAHAASSPPSPSRP